MRWLFMITQIDHIAQSPCTLGTCEHVVCNVCVEKYIGACCPVCGLPGHARDAEVDRQLFNLVTLCKRLKSILNSGGNGPKSEDKAKGDGSRSCKANETVEQTNHRTPSKKNKTVFYSKQVDDILSKSNKTVSYSKQVDDSPSKNNKTVFQIEELKKPFSETNEAACSVLNSDIDPESVCQNNEDNSSSKLVQNNKKRKSRLKSEKNNEKEQSSSRTDVQTRNKASTEDQESNMGQRSKSLSSLPEGQSTMTQFYDYMDEVDLLTHLPMDEGQSDEVLNEAKECKTRDKKGKQTSTDKRSDMKRNTSRDQDQSKAKLNTILQRPEVKNSSVKCEILGSDTPLSKEKTKKSKSGKSADIVETAAIVGEPTPNKKLKYESSPAVQINARSRSHATPRSRSNPNSSATSPIIAGSLEKKNSKGETLLHVAAIKNDVQRVAELLQEGANPNTRDNAGWTPLHEACNHGYSEVARLLLDNGALINVPGMDNESPLHDAVTNSRLDCVRLLVSRGASLTVRTLQGFTPIDLAKTAEMKEALKAELDKTVPSVSPETIDPLEYQLPCFLGTSLSREQRITMQKCAAILQAKVTEEFTPEVTHLVIGCNQNGTCPRTIKYLHAVLTGKWIVGFDWISTCIEYKTRVCEEAFEVPGTSISPDSGAAHKGQMNRKQQLPGLFDGCQFYFHGTFEYPTPEKEELLELVKNGGGRILMREPKPGHHCDEDLTVPYHAPPHGNLKECCFYIVHDTSLKFPPIRTPRLCSVPASWIMNCIDKFILLDPPDEN
ncbi:hypothetical protein CHS0354_019683 [Potamilus streckersoni]|uniref:BRCT domain-containing protein n=1 Tax=Potamilus streckersoni TaxID=2493646 RepID=A0AAE0VRE5_9BIVA|nr:hypothetical protein CHS0354_019683 [Potamilus streckersoni]